MRPHPKDVSPANEPVSHSESSQRPEEILEYWTPERLKEARPREIRLPDKETCRQETRHGSEGK